MLEVKEEFYAEEEIDLYDILDIVLKYKKKIGVILLVGFLLSFGAALVARQFRSEIATREYRINYENLEGNVYFSMVGLPYSKFDPNNILEDEKYLNRFLEIPALKALYKEKENSNEREDLAKKKKFIKKVIQIIPVSQNNPYNKVSISLRKGKEAIPEIMKLYFTILEEEIPKKIQHLLLQNRELALKNNAISRAELEKMKEKLNAVLNGGLRAISMEELQFLISLRYPILVSEKNIYQGEYTRTLNQIIGTDALLQSSSLDNIIETRGAMVLEQEKSKAMIVLLGGIFMSFVFAFCYVMGIEFSQGYKKHKKEQKLLGKNN